MQRALISIVMPKNYPFLFLMLLFFMQPTYAIDGFENNLTKEILPKDFSNIVIREINKERMLKGLSVLVSDPIAQRSAQNHSRDLITKGYLSYFNSKKQGPDERYTLEGGKGAVSEIVKGFEIPPGSSNIFVNELLARQFVEALALSDDDSRLLFNPYLTHAAVNANKSEDGSKFVAVLEFVNIGGDFSGIEDQITLGNKISLSGMVSEPYKFKAVSVAYLEDEEDLESVNNKRFDNDLIKPYFPPQDYIAFTDTKKRNALNVLKGIGIIGATVAAPFTAGATALISPFLANSMRGEPKEIPLKGGISSHKDGSFNGDVKLDYKDQPGLYFISVLGKVEGVKYPVVISRRTVRVNQPLTSSSK